MEKLCLFPDLKLILQCKEWKWLVELIEVNQSRCVFLFVNLYASFECVWFMVFCKMNVFSWRIVAGKEKNGAYFIYHHCIAVYDWSVCPRNFSHIPSSCKLHWTYFPEIYCPCHFHGSGKCNIFIGGISICFVVLKLLSNDLWLWLIVHNYFCT